MDDVNLIISFKRQSGGVAEISFSRPLIQQSTSPLLGSTSSKEAIEDHAL